MILEKGHRRVSIQNLPLHVLTWNFCHRFASMWNKMTPNNNTRNSFFWELWRGKEKFKKWFFLKKLWPILMNKIYVVDINVAIPEKKFFKIAAKEKFVNFFWGYVVKQYEKKIMKICCIFYRLKRFWKWR